MTEERDARPPHLDAEAAASNAFCPSAESRYNERASQPSAEVRRGQVQQRLANQDFVRFGAYRPENFGHLAPIHSGYCQHSILKFAYVRIERKRTQMPRVYNSIIVDAPIETVWQRIADFHDFSWAPSVVTRCEKVGDKGGTAVGAKRLLNGIFLDTLIAYSVLEHRISYSIDDGPSPISPSEISNYVGILHLLPITSERKTFAEWSGAWESKDTNAVPFMNDIYIALLRDLAVEFHK